MNIINGDVKIRSKTLTSQSTPVEIPNTKWDTWDVRVFWGKPLINTSAYPPSYQPITKFLIPHGQIWP